MMEVPLEITAKKTQIVQLIKSANMTWLHITITVLKMMEVPLEINAKKTQIAQLISSANMT